MIAQDKVFHLVAGAGIALVAGVMIHPLAGLVCAALAGAAKELFDRLGYGIPDRWDFVVTVVGGVLGAFVALVIRA